MLCSQYARGLRATMKVPRKYSFSFHAEGTALLKRATLRQ